MSAKKYIALKAIQLVDADGARQSIEPRSADGKVSGLFEHSFSAKDEKRLIRLGAIREPEGTEEHETPTTVEAMDDTRDGGGQQTNPNEDGLDDMKVADLKALADREVIDLGDATKKDDIVAAIRKARAAEAGGE